VRALWLIAFVTLGCPPAPMGTRCAQHSDCRAMPEGYCARAELCTRVCDEAPCPDGYRCSSEGPRRVCLPACDDGTPCLDGFGCQRGGGGSVCRLAAPLAKLPAR
jgi:hypothetical protein